MRFWGFSAAKYYGQTDRRTDRPKPICPLNFSEVGGIKKQRNFAIISVLPFLNNPKDLDPSYKTDPDFGIVLEGKNTLTYIN